MNRNVFFLTVCLTVPLWAEDPALEPSEELTLAAPWSSPVALVNLESGPYRLEALTLAGDPVEVVLEQYRGGWEPAGSNRAVNGTLRAELEWTAAQERWRVRPVRTETRTVVLRLRKTAFSGLRDVLKQGITASPEVGLPLKKRLELPPGSGGDLVSAAAGPRGELWVAWSAGGTVEVWDVSRLERVGRGLRPGFPWTSMELRSGPALEIRGPSQGQTWAWSGLDWTEEALPPAGLTTPLGTFRYDTSPPRVWRASATGWIDLGLPRTAMDRMLLGSTQDGLYALLAASTSASRAFYRWQVGEGWQELVPPPASGPPRGLWAATNGAGSLFHLEGNGSRLELRAFDGGEWRPALDLLPLAPRGARAAVLLPPSPWSKSGTLVLATDRVSVYDLP